MSGWFEVPAIVATRHRGRILRELATAQGCDVLDFRRTQVLTATAADELVCNGHWIATTGESPEIREAVERAQRRRGQIPPEVQG